MTKPDPFALGTLVAWLEKQPAEKTYDYTEPCGCMLADYFTQNGYSDVAVDPFAFDHSGGRTDIPGDFDVVNCEGERTYGAALDRARALVQR